MRIDIMMNEILNKSLLSQSGPAVKTEAVQEVDTSSKSISNVVTIESDKEGAKAIESTVSRLNNMVQSIERDLNFRVDETSGKTVITVLDTKTEEIIRQIPAEHVLAISANIESLKGILFSVEV